MENAKDYFFIDYEDDEDEFFNVFYGDENDFESAEFLATFVDEEDATEYVDMKNDQVCKNRGCSQCA